MSSDEQLRRIDALIGVGLRIARSAPSGRIALARLARAIDVDWIPRPWGDELAVELHASLKVVAEPLPPRTVERILRDAWGVKPDKELDSLEPEPVAVTPTSQVHRGELDGEPVAVKVLRPGVVNSVRQDLALLDALLMPLGAAFPGIDARAIVREFRQRVLEEFDLESEATAQRRFHRALRRHPLLRVPAPVMRLTHAPVMVSEWVEGVSLVHAPDRDRATAQLLLFHMGAAAAGLVHADLDPEDVRVQADGRLAILDFGCWAEVPAERVALAREMVAALQTRDSDGFAGALQRLGWLPLSAAGAAAERAERFLALIADRLLNELARPGIVRLDGDAIGALRDRLLALDERDTELLLSGGLPAEDLWPARGAAQLFSVIARVGASGAWLELTGAALRDGWDAKLPAS